MARRRKPQKKNRGSGAQTSIFGSTTVLPPPLPSFSGDEDDCPIPSSPPPGPASQRVLFWDKTSLGNSSTHEIDNEHFDSNGKQQRNIRRLNGISKRSVPNGAGWECLRISLSPSSYRESFHNLQSMYQSMVGRSFSIIVQSEEVFWSTLLQGFSVLPLFMFVATACSNTAMGILFTAVGDVPHLQGWADWMRLCLSTIGTMVALRNLLVSMYELVLDSTAQYPLLNPGLLSRLRSIIAVRQHGLQRFIAILQLTSCCTLYGLTLLGTQQGNLPTVWLSRCHIFGANTAIKLLTWWLYEFYEAGVKAAAAKSGRLTPAVAPRHSRKQHLQPLRHVRKAIIYYVATSDVILLLFLMGNYLPRGGGRELLQLKQDAQHDELERRVVAFNSLALVMTNFAAFGMFTYEALTYGTHLLDRAIWTASIAHSRQASLIFTGLAYCVSMHRYGYLPSFFTLLVVFNGLSLSKVTLWACIEVQRTLLPLWESVRKHPAGVILVLLTYVLATRTPSDALLLTLFVASAFWAWQIQVRWHYVDVWAFGLTALAVLMALHQVWHGDRHLQPAAGGLGQNQDNGIFRVQLSSTHLNITSGLGPKSIVLRTFHSVSSSFTSGSASSAQNYPFCELNFYGLSLLDYAGLCFLAYLKRDSPAFQTFFSAAFDPAEWEVKHAPSPGKKQGVVFLDIYNRRLNTSVIAIRGTNPTNLFDVFQDMIMFNGAFCWDVVGMLVPLVQWLPSMWTANLLYLSYLPLKLKFNSMPAYRELSLHYHREIQSYVEEIHDRKVVLTGHSLGGGIGKIVAARLLLPIVAISAPGITLSHKLFDVPRENLDKFEVNLISAEDLVPNVDRLKGLIMKMHCNKSNPLSCHELSYTLSELHDQCGLPFFKERYRK